MAFSTVSVSVFLYCYAHFCACFCLENLQQQYIYILTNIKNLVSLSPSFMSEPHCVCVCVCVAQREPIPENDSFAVEKGTSLLGKLCPVLPGYCFTHTGNYTIVWGIDSPATALARCTLGWSDLDLFSIFENGHYAADEVHTFMIPSPKNRRIWPRAYTV